MCTGAAPSRESAAFRRELTGRGGRRACGRPPRSRGRSRRSACGPATGGASPPWIAAAVRVVAPRKGVGAVFPSWGGVLRNAHFMVLRERIELSTSPLPRECSTTELPQRAGRRRKSGRPLGNGAILAIRAESAQGRGARRREAVFLLCAWRV